MCGIVLVCTFLNWFYPSSIINFDFISLFTFRVGTDIPKIEVRFEHLSIEGDAYVGTRALPTLLNATLNSIEVFFSPIHWFFSFPIICVLSISTGIA